MKWPDEVHLAWRFITGHFDHGDCAVVVCCRAVHKVVGIRVCTLYVGLYMYTCLPLLIMLNWMVSPLELGCAEETGATEVTIIGKPSFPTMSLCR